VECGVGVLGHVFGPGLLLVEDGHEVGRLRLVQLDTHVVQRFLLRWNSWNQFNKRLESFLLYFILFTVPSTSLKKTILFSGFKILLQKNPRNKKTPVYS
jgi:hypothetical protein